MNEFNVNNFFTREDDSDFLGRGSYASVRRCHHKDLGNVVVKCFNIGVRKQPSAESPMIYKTKSKFYFACNM